MDLSQLLRLSSADLVALLEARVAALSADVVATPLTRRGITFDESWLTRVRELSHDDLAALIAQIDAYATTIQFLGTQLRDAALRGRLSEHHLDVSADPLPESNPTLLSSLHSGSSDSRPDRKVPAAHSGVRWRWYFDVLDLHGRRMGAVRVTAETAEEAARVATRRIAADRTLGQAVPYRQAVQT